MRINKTAFSLIELSIVILIIAAIAALTLANNINNNLTQKNKLTNDRIREIYKAMGIYLAKNGKLPCPAPINLTRDNANYGKAASTCTSAPSSGSGYWQSSDSVSSNVYYGAVPIRNLELSSYFAEDGFGSKFGYAIISGFTDSTKFGTSNNSTNGTYAISGGSDRLVIKELLTNGTSQITNDAMFVIISYGANKSGAFDAMSTTQNTASSVTEELNNTGTLSTGAGSTNAFDKIFYSSSISSGFDDIVFYKSRTDMVQDFNLMYLLFCDTSSGAITDAKSTTGSFTWNISTARYGGIYAATSGTCNNPTAVTYPARRCGLNGWEGVNVIDCT